MGLRRRYRVIRRRTEQIDECGAGRTLNVTSPAGKTSTMTCQASRPLHKWLDLNVDVECLVAAIASAAQTNEGAPGTLMVTIGGHPGNGRGLLAQIERR